MEDMGPMCQSCGMPLKEDAHHGTNEDGSKNEEYCKFCYQDGDFTDAGISMEDKIEKIVQLAVSQMGMQEDEARAMANSIIPKLKRWQG
ncbi:zinc ribbon domain-containing protein [Patescibacteria group bacterium]